MENYIELLSLAIKAAVLAGKEIMQVYAKDFAVEYKNDNSPLTEADHNAHLKITAVLEQTELPILSEEGCVIPFDERKHWKLFWMVDPLDGTKEFVKRNGEFTVNIALIKEHVPVLGVIYAPVLNTLYFGCEGIGSYKLTCDIEQLCDLIQSEQIVDDLIKSAYKLPVKNTERIFTVVASRSHLSAETSEYIDQLKRKHGELQMISKGSSLKLCLVAEGAADVYPRFAPTMEWDTAAGQAIALFAGVKVINAIDQTPIIYNKSALLNPWFIVE